MKSFFSRFCLFGAPFIVVAQSSLSVAAPVDPQSESQSATALPWLKGVLPVDFPSDEFSRAIAALEACRTAENEAARRAARGEMAPRELQAFRSATERAKKRVEELLQNIKPQTATPVLRVPVMASLPAERNPVKVPTPQPISQPTTPAKIILPQGSKPHLTALGHSADGTIASPLFGSRQSAKMRGGLRFIALLPAQQGTPQPVLTTANNSKPTVVLPPTTPAIKTAVPTTTPKAPAPKVVVNATLPAVNLQRLAQLDAELRRADKRLSAANDALSEGQQQLTRFAGTLRQAMLEAGPDAVGLHPFVKVAEKYAGTPYVWGGESRTGFDCSGMIIRVMRDLGYKALPHSAAEQFRYGKPIAQELLKPGDLVFFANTYKAGISHVGIYLGKRRFIHAAGTGKGTIVSSLDAAKFQEKYAGARRLIAARGQ